MKNHLKWNLLKEEIDDLDKLIRKFQESPQQVYRIDADLALDKVRRIYDNLKQMKTQNATFIFEERDEEKLNQEITKEESVNEIPDEPEHKKEPDFKPVVVPEPIVELKMVSKEAKEKEPPSSLVDLFSASTTQEKSVRKMTVMEKMTEEKPVETVAEKIGKKKISSLTQAIGINEKFFFINELFEGNMKEYKNSIDTLDQTESLAAAAEFLEILISKNSWDKTGEAYNMLLDFVERKFH